MMGECGKRHMRHASKILCLGGNHILFDYTHEAGKYSLPHLPHDLVTFLFLEETKRLGVLVPVSTVINRVAFHFML